MVLAAALLFTAWFAPTGMGQQRSEPEAEQEPQNREGAEGDEDRVRLDFAPNTSLTTLIAFVSERLGLNILYDQAEVNQKITLRTPDEIPESALLDLLDSALRARYLTMTRTSVPGLWHIQSAQELAGAARLAEPGEGGGAKRERGAVTRVFDLEHVSAQEASGLIAPMLSKPGGNAVVLPGGGLIVVSDYAENVGRIARLIERIDTPRGEPVVRVVDLEHADAERVVDVVQPALDALARGGGGGEGGGRQGGGAPAGATVNVARGNRLVIAAPPRVVEMAEELIGSLDRPQRMLPRVYEPEVVGAEQLGRLIEDLIGGDSSYRVAVDARGGRVVVSAPPPIHAQVEQLLAGVDVPVDREQVPVRYYKLKNTVAEDVLATIRALESRGQRGVERTSGYGPEPLMDRNERGDRLFGAQPREPDSGPVVRGGERGGPPPEPVERTQPNPALSPPTLAAPAPSGSTAAVAGGDGAEAAVSSGFGEEARVAADPNTNSIIVIAPPAQQRIYEQIIEKLDQRRPQVMIETTVVTLDTSEDFSLGVDIGRITDTGDGRLITFSSLGVSSVDPATGSLSPTNALGGTAALLSPDIADIVIRALSTSTRSRLVSMPRVLVNDNEDATLKSVNQEPFQRTVITDQATIVGEGETAEAGTEITVTPHISADDYLQLEYDVELSSFTGQRQPNLPPPSQENNIASRVTIPDGHTIVVGGLNRSNLRRSVNRVPLLGELPIIKHLFRSEDRSESNTTLFVFIRPTILRDDRFRDLRYLSGVQRDQAEVNDDFPESEPMMLKPSR